MPPATEVNVQTNAYRYALSGRASDIGISITSGGTGKNELSANETPPRIQVAYFLSAASMHQSYRRLNMRRLLSGRSYECLSGWTASRARVTGAFADGGFRAPRPCGADRRRSDP